METLRLIANDFRGMLDTSKLTIAEGLDAPYNREIPICFNHEAGTLWREGDHRRLIERYEGKIRRFRSILENGNPTIAVLNYLNPFDAEAQNALIAAVEALPARTAGRLRVLCVITAPSAPEWRETYAERVTKTATLTRVYNEVPAAPYEFYRPESYTSPDGVRYKRGFLEAIQTLSTWKPGSRSRSVSRRRPSAEAQDRKRHRACLRHENAPRGGAGGAEGRILPETVGRALSVTDVPSGRRRSSRAGTACAIRPDRPPPALEIIAMRLLLLAASFLFLPAPASALCQCSCVQGQMKAICQPTDLMIPICQGICETQLRPDRVTTPLAGGRPAYGPAETTNPSPGGLISPDADLNTNRNGQPLEPQTNSLEAWAPAFPAAVKRTT